MIKINAIIFLQIIIKSIEIEINSNEIFNSLKFFNDNSEIIIKNLDYIDQIDSKLFILVEKNSSKLEISIDQNKINTFSENNLLIIPMISLSYNSTSTIIIKNILIQKMNLIITKDNFHYTNLTSFKINTFIKENNYIFLNLTSKESNKIFSTVQANQNCDLEIKKNFIPEFSEIANNLISVNKKYFSFEINKGFLLIQINNKLKYDLNKNYMCNYDFFITDNKIKSDSNEKIQILSNNFDNINIFDTNFIEIFNPLNKDLNFNIDKNLISVKYESLYQNSSSFSFSSIKLLENQLDSEEFIFVITSKFNSSELLEDITDLKNKDIDIKTNKYYFFRIENIFTTLEFSSEKQSLISYSIFSRKDNLSNKDLNFQTYLTEPFWNYNDKLRYLHHFHFNKCVFLNCYFVFKIISKEEKEVELSYINTNCAKLDLNSIMTSNDICLYLEIPNNIENNNYLSVGIYLNNTNIDSFLIKYNNNYNTRDNIIEVFEIDKNLSKLYFFIYSFPLKGGKFLDKFIQNISSKSYYNIIKLEDYTNYPLKNKSVIKNSILSPKENSFSFEKIQIDKIKYYCIDFDFKNEFESSETRKIYLNEFFLLDNQKFISPDNFECKFNNLKNFQKVSLLIYDELTKLYFLYNYTYLINNNNELEFQTPKVINTEKEIELIQKLEFKENNIAKIILGNSKLCKINYFDLKSKDFEVKSITDEELNLPNINIVKDHADSILIFEFICKMKKKIFITIMNEKNIQFNNVKENTVYSSYLNNLIVNTNKLQINFNGSDLSKKFRFSFYDPNKIVSQVVYNNQKLKISSNSYSSMLYFTDNIDMKIEKSNTISIEFNNTQSIPITEFIYYIDDPQNWKEPKEINSNDYMSFTYNPLIKQEILLLFKNRKSITLQLGDDISGVYSNITNSTILTNLINNKTGFSQNTYNLKTENQTTHIRISLDPKNDFINNEFYLYRAYEEYNLLSYDNEISTDLNDPFVFCIKNKTDDLKNKGFLYVYIDHQNRETSIALSHSTIPTVSKYGILNADYQTEAKSDDQTVFKFNILKNKAYQSEIICGIITDQKNDNSDINKNKRKRKVYFWFDDSFLDESNLYFMLKDSFSKLFLMRNTINFKYIYLNLDIGNKIEINLNNITEINNTIFSYTEKYDIKNTIEDKTFYSFENCKNIIFKISPINNEMIFGRVELLSDISNPNGFITNFQSKGEEKILLNNNDWNKRRNKEIIIQLLNKTISENINIEIIIDDNKNRTIKKVLNSSNLDIKISNERILNNFIIVNSNSKSNYFLYIRVFEEKEIKEDEIKLIDNKYSIIGDLSRDSYEKNLTLYNSKNSDTFILSKSQFYPEEDIRLTISIYKKNKNNELYYSPVFVYLYSEIDSAIMNIYDTTTKNKDYLIHLNYKITRSKNYNSERLNNLVDIYVFQNNPTEEKNNFKKYTFLTSFNINPYNNTLQSMSNENVLVNIFLDNINKNDNCFYIKDNKNPIRKLVKENIFIEEMNKETKVEIICPRTTTILVSFLNEKNLNNSIIDNIKQNRNCFIVDKKDSEKNNEIDILYDKCLIDKNIKYYSIITPYNKRKPFKYSDYVYEILEKSDSKTQEIRYSTEYEVTVVAEYFNRSLIKLNNQRFKKEEPTKNEDNMIFIIIFLFGGITIFFLAFFFIYRFCRNKSFKEGNENIMED